jgi:tetratricopeptide (TPR) repeat protein
LKSVSSDAPQPDANAKGGFGRFPTGRRFLSDWGDALLLVLTLVAYAPSVRNGFIWDDDQYVTTQQTLRSLEGLGRIWNEAQAIPQYYPVTFTSLWLDYQLWGLNPLGYHIENVLQHVLIAVLLRRVLGVLGVPGAWWAAAVFALHPVHVESVEWITERKNTLSGVFYMATLLVYLRFLFAPPGTRRPWGAYALALVLFVLALFSKTVTATLPVVLLLLAWWRKGRVAWSDALPIVPFFLVGALLAWVTTLMETFHVGAMGQDFSQSLTERCLIAGRVIWFYIGKLLWPHPLIFSYPRWTIDAGAWWQYLFPFSAFAVFATLWAVQPRIGRGPVVVVLYFVVTLVPVLGFLNVYPMRFSFVADHFQYLASIGPIVLATATVASVAQLRGPSTARRLRFAGCCYLVVLGALTWRQTLIYRDAKTVWFDTLAKNPKSWLAHNNLGAIFEQEGNHAAAKAHYEATLAMSPGDAPTFSSIGAIIAAEGHTVQATAYFEAALRIDPEHAEAHHNLGNALAVLGRTDEAIRAYREAIRIRPRYAYAHGNLAGALAAQGKTEEAIASCREAVLIDPEYAEGHYNLGTLLQRAGRLDEARTSFEDAIRVRPTYALPYYRLGLLLASQHKTDEAVIHLREAARLNPADHEAILALERTLRAQAQIPAK